MPNYNSLLRILGRDQDTDPVEEYIRSFSELQEGWNFGEGIAPSDEVIDKALQIYRLGKSFLLIGNAFPVGDGEIEISFSHKDHFIDILITGQNTLEYSYEIGIGDEYSEIEQIHDVSLEKLESKLSMMEEIKLCNSLEYSMQNDTLIGIREDSKALALEYPVQVSPSLIEIVWSSITAPQYATT